MTTPAYPLAWPSGWKRTPRDERRPGLFGVRRGTTLVAISIAEGTARVRSELRTLGADPQSIVISSNVPLRKDGFPRSDLGEPQDPGVAVYFERDEHDCLAIDVYDRAADNLAAIAATINAMRALGRHGGAQILQRAFQGFKALPAVTGTAMNIDVAWATLEKFAGCQRVDVERRGRGLAQDTARHARFRTHPDRGGNADDFMLVNRAADTLSAEYGWAL